MDFYYERIKKTEVAITAKLDTWPYAMSDFQLKDLDGNLLCFGCEPELG